MQRLSSGLRINNASDDAAGMAISNLATKGIMGNTQAIQNVNDGISLTQTHASALDSVGSLYNRARTLALQAANGTTSNGDRAIINKEYTQIMQSVDNIFKNTNFNGKKLFQNGAGTPVQIQSGSTPSDTTSINKIDYSTMNGATLPTDVLSQTNAQAAITTLDGAIDNASLSAARLGATTNGLIQTNSYLETSNLQAKIARGRITDADYAKESTHLAKYDTLTQTGLIMLSKVNENKAAMVDLLNL